MWAVVLIPMWLRRHDEAEESRSVDRFTAAMHTLSRRDLKDAEDRSMVMPHRSRGVEVHVSGASAAQIPAPRYRSTSAARVSAARVTAAHRRRRTLLTTLGLAFVFLLAAAFTGSLLLWVLEVMVDLAAIAFVIHLRRMAILSASSRARRPAPARRVVADVPPAPRQSLSTAERQQQRRWEHQRTDVGGYGEQVSIRHDSERLAESRQELPRYVDAAFVKAHRAQARYDEIRTAAVSYAEPEAEPAVFDQSAPAQPSTVADPSPGFDQTAPFDQTNPYDEPHYDDVAVASDGFFDQESFVEPVAPEPEPEMEQSAVEGRIVEEPSYARYSGPGFIETGAQRGRRDFDAHEVAATVAPEPVREAPIEPVTAVGGTPWEPVPVPRPTYTMKPAAPPRRRRYEPDEPLLPPVEPVAATDDAAELEEILDRRWAVND
jgi:hypothetical protein